MGRIFFCFWDFRVGGDGKSGCDWIGGVFDAGQLPNVLDGDYL